MSAPSKLPSVGFVAVLLVHAVLVAFLFWGFAQPPLDRVWELSHELRIGRFGTLAPSDLALLRSTLARHPRLADAILSRDDIAIISANSRGWLETPDATLLVSAKATGPCSMSIAARLEPIAFPLRVEISGAGWSRQLEVPDARGAELTFPKAGPNAEVVEVRFSGKAAARAGVHLGPRCREKVARP